MTLSHDNSNDQRDRRSLVDAVDECSTELARLLNGRVPLDVPDEVASSIRSQFASELSGSTSADRQPPGRQFKRSKVGRWLLSLEFLVPALIVACLGGHFAVVWHSDRRIAAIVGDQEQPPDISSSAARAMRLAATESDAITMFEMNVSLIRQELRYEQSESFRDGFGRERQPETRGPSSQKEMEKVPDHSGAAVAPRSGIQRDSKLAGCFCV